MKKYHPFRITCILALAFWLCYTIVVGSVYPNILRMMEANSWLNNYVLQFFRWPYMGAAIIGGILTIGTLLLTLLMDFMRLKRWTPATLLLTCLLAYLYPPTIEKEYGKVHLFSKVMNEQEHICHYIFLANNKSWSELKKEIYQNNDARKPLGMRFCLLAESAQGTLADALFSYPITSSEQFLFRGMSGLSECQINRLFYENLEVWDEAFHQAQEYTTFLNDFCFMSVCQMADYSIKEAEWSVAEKLLCVLDEALFYHDFVKERRTMIAEGKKMKPVNDAPVQNMNFISGFSFQNEMVYLLSTNTGNTTKVTEYTLCSILIKKKIEQFIQAFYQTDSHLLKPVPLSYRQALQIYESRGTALRDAMPGSYAYYFYNTDIPKIEEHYQSDKLRH